MRLFICAAAVIVTCLSVAPLARADHAPALVIPGKRGVPVVINGYDASYAVVEGDWGLSRPGHVPPTLIDGPLLRPTPVRPGYYFPMSGRQPGYGRFEIEPPPNRILPPPAPSYHRSWGTQSEPLPANMDPPAQTSLDISITPEERERRRFEREQRREHRRRPPRRERAR